MAEFNWDDHPVEEAQSFNWDDHPVEQPSSNQSWKDWGLEKVGQASDFMDSYLGSPVRAGISAAQHGENPASAYWNQLGEDPHNAPTGKQIASYAGLDDQNEMFNVPLGKITEKLPGIIGAPGALLHAGAQLSGLDQTEVAPTPAGAAGYAIDMAADPINFIPGGELVKGLGGVEKAAKAASTAERAAKEVGAFDRAANSIRGVADKLYLKSTGATGKQLEKFAPDAAQELRKYVRPFDSPENIADKLTEAMEMSGSDVGAALHDLDKMGATVHTKDVVNRLRQRAAELGADPSQINTATKLNTIADQIDASIGVRRNVGGYTVPGDSGFQGQTINRGGYTVPGREAQINSPGTGSYNVPGTQATERVSFNPGTGERISEVTPGMAPATVPIKAPARMTINPRTGMPEALPDVPGYGPTTVPIVENTALRTNPLTGLQEAIPNRPGYGPTTVPIVENTRLKTNPVTGMMEESTGPIPLSQSENIKRGFGAKIKNWLDPESGAANKEAYRAYMLEGERAAQNTNPELAQTFAESKKAYGLLDPILESAAKRANTLNQSPLGGLGDTAAQAVGMVPGGNTLKGLATAAGRRVIAPRLASTGAWSADKLADAVRETPMLFGKFAGTLSEAAQRGGNSLAATHYILESTDPEYREIIRNIADGEQ